jgi:glycosyltransferase involved in cell wall biosynthesis
MSKQKLWIISELFYPDQTSTSYILSMIANAFVDKYDVHVITDSELYQANKKKSNSFFTISDSLKIKRVKTLSFDKNKLLQRFLKLLFLSIKFSIEVYLNTRKGDKVLVVTNPAPFLILASLLKKIRKFELFILVHDVFPENTIPAGVIKKKTTLLYRLLSSIFNIAYSNADHLIVLGRDMKEIVCNKINFCNSKPEISIIENWGDITTIFPSETTTDLILKRHNERLISIQYAGNIGRVQGLQSFICKLNLSENRKIIFDIWGDGAIKSELIELVSNLGLQERVNFCGIYSRDEHNSILNTTDIALVTLSSGMYGLGVPSKTYNILAAGKPILYIGDLNSEIALLIREEDIGFCFDADDSEGILKFLDNISLDDLSTIRNMSIRARKIVEEKYSEDVILNKFRNLI